VTRLAEYGNGFPPTDSSRAKRRESLDAADKSVRATRRPLRGADSQSAASTLMWTHGPGRLTGPGGSASRHAIVRFDKQAWSRNRCI
jgi:hypothetical protein